MLTRFFVKHPVTTWMIFVAFAVLAVYAVPRIEVEAIPEIDLPTLSIQTSWPGASPKSVQRSITILVEGAVRKVHGVQSVESQSRPSSSSVTAEFDRDVDLDFARLELNEQLGSVRRELPPGATPPEITTFVPEEFETEQFFSFSILSSLEANDLREEAENWIQPQILAIDGVSDARVVGGADPLLKILLDRQLLELHDIQANEIYAAINSLDEVTGAGAVREDGMEKLVSIRRNVDLDVIREATVARRSGRNYRLHELGRVEAGANDPVYIARKDGKNVVQIQVEKRSGANSVSVSKRLRAALPEIEASVPFDASLRVDKDEGEKLNEKLQELVVRSGVILVVLFVLLAVTLRQVHLTAIVIASVLFALVICLSLFYFLRLSVNFITISGLTICFGMLLDNSILVLDSIERKLKGLERAERAGLTRASKLRVAMQTVVSGTGEVVFPIIATTLTTMVAFLSFIFLGGRLALYYVPLAVAISTALFASVFVAFGWIPVVLNQSWATRLVRRSHDGTHEIEDEAEIVRLVEELPELEAKPRRREKVFGWVQRLWWISVPALVVLCLFSWNVYDNKVVKGGFFRFGDDELLIFFMRMPEGTDIRVVSEIMEKFEALLLPLEEGATMYSQVFGNSAYMEIEFSDDLKRSPTPFFYRQSLVSLGDNTGGATLFIRGYSDQPYFKGSFRGNSLNSLVKISGYNSKRLEVLAEDTVAKVQTNRRVRNARIASASRFGPSNLDESVITLRRDVLAEKGLSVSGVVLHVQRLLGVDRTNFMRISGDEERVKLAYLDSEDIQYSDVAAQTMISSTGEKVRLLDLVELSTQPMSSTITREDQRYTSFVNWEFVGTDRMRRDYIQNILDSMDLPYGYAAEADVQEELTDEEEKELMLTLGLAVGFIFMVLAALFESISLPFLVLSSVPMALVGVVMVYWWSGVEFDSSARIGLVLLFGIVVNNVILLVSRYRREAELVLKAHFGGDPNGDAALFISQRKQLGGEDLRRLPKEMRVEQLWRIVARGTLVKMRSVLLTSGTTVVGLLPLLVTLENVVWTPGWLFGLSLPWTLHWLDNENPDIWENLAFSTVGGLVSSTILLIIAIPALYYMSVRISWWVRRLCGWIGSSFHRRGDIMVSTDVQAGSQI